MIGTSIYIERGRLGRLQKAADFLHIKESELLSLLLMKSRRLFGDMAVTGKTVDYQDNDCGSDFLIYHINIDESDYEFATGRRYLFKISVSYIFRLAVDNFLSEIIYEWTHKRIQTEHDWKEYKTNIYTTCFSIMHIVKETAEFWIIPWPRE